MGQAMSKWIIQSLLGSLCMLLATSGAYAAPQAGQVATLVGTADVTRGAAAAVALQVGDGVYVQDVVRTKSRSRLVMQMTDGSRLTLGPSSRLVVAQYQAEAAAPKGLFELARGRMRAIVTDVFSSRRESFKVQTSTAVVGVQGTDFDVLSEADLTRVHVYGGIVSVANIDARIPGIQILRQNEAAIIRRGAAPEPIVPVAGQQPVGSGGTLSLLSDQGTFAADSTLPTQSLMPPAVMTMGSDSNPPPNPPPH